MEKEIKIQVPEGYEEEAVRFLKYNEQLVKDYFML